MDARAEEPGGPVAGVLFDLGGTLFSYAERERMGLAFTVALERAGLEPSAPEVRAARQTASAEVSRAYAARPFFLHTELFRDRLVRTASLLGVDLPAELLERYAADNARAIVEAMPPRADAARTLAALRQRGIYCAVVSNADDAWLEPALRRHGLDALLDHWTSSEEARSCKPDTAIFTYSLRKARLDPGDVLFVGDSLQHDIAGARAAGLRSVLVRGDGEAPLADGFDAVVRPDYEIDELAEVVPIVDGLNRHR